MYIHVCVFAALYTHLVQLIFSFSNQNIQMLALHVQLYIIIHV